MAEILIITSAIGARADTNENVIPLLSQVAAHVSFLCEEDLAF